MNDSRKTENGQAMALSLESWFGSFWKRLTCWHLVREPISDRFYGSHSQWDIIGNPPRCWRCVDCGKVSVFRHPPVNYVGPR